MTASNMGEGGLSPESGHPGHRADLTSEAGDQYSHSPVPGDATMAGWRVALIVASFSIGLPDFLNGAQNALALGLWGAVVAALLAALALCIGCCFTAVVSVRTRLSTYLLVRRSFGFHGAALINVVIALIHYGAFGLNAAFVGEALGTAAQVNGIPEQFAASVIIGSVVSAGATIIGIRALERLSLMVVPVLAVIFIAVAAIAVQRYGLATAPSAHPPVPMRFGIAVTALIGNYMLAVATMPDLSRYIRTERGAITSMALSFPIATPLMMVTAALPALATGETSVSKLVVSLGIGTPLLFVLTLPMLTVNAANLYSAGLALSTTFPQVRRWVFVTLGATIGTVFALMGILDHFVQFLVFLGLIIPPIAAIYVIDAFTVFRSADPAASIRDLPRVRWEAIGIWLGSLVVILAETVEGFSITSVPALDATLIAATAYIAVLKLKVRVGRVVRNTG